MTLKKFYVTMKDGKKLYTEKWDSKENSNPKAVIQISHGMAEHSDRYDYFANKLVKEGYIVYAHTHRGHGKNVDSILKLGDIAPKEGFMQMVNDLHTINNYIKKENTKNLPIILLGHSMGSFVLQRYLEIYGDTVDAAVIMGSNGKPNISVTFGEILAKLMINIKGRSTTATLLDKLAFGSHNKKIENPRTPFDWLSRDNSQVDKYMADPFCGTTFTNGFFYDLARGTKSIHQNGNLSKIPSQMPLLVISGDADPVGEWGEGVKRLYNNLKEAGIKDVTLKLYEGGRHEILNETNRDEVIADILCWIEKVVKLQSVVVEDNIINL